MLNSNTRVQLHNADTQSSALLACYGDRPERNNPSNPNKLKAQPQLMRHPTGTTPFGEQSPNIIMHGGLHTLTLLY